jgi:hypothetical protein
LQQYPADDDQHHAEHNAAISIFTEHHPGQHGRQHRFQIKQQDAGRFGQRQPGHQQVRGLPRHQWR